MITIGALAILRPWWLLGLPLLALLFLVSKPRDGGLGAWDKAAEPHLLAAMTARGASVSRGRLRAPAVLFTLLFGIVALAGPAIRRTDQSRLRNLDATVLIVDASQDMRGSTAIREAASTAHDVMQHLSARQAGLIVYGGDAYVATALTDFTGAIDTDLFALDEDTVPDPGVRPDRALILAKKMLQEAHILSGDVVLVSGGGGLKGTGAIRAAADLADAGHRVYVVDAVPAGRDGKTERSTALDAVARAGGGFAVELAHPDALLQVLSDETIRRTGNSLVNALDWHDLGRFLLVLAALPLLTTFRKAATA